jgi:hypothetical protein
VAGRPFDCGFIVGAARKGRGRTVASILELERERFMLDIIFIAATALFFAVGVLYVRGCERLK